MIPVWWGLSLSLSVQSQVCTIQPLARHFHRSWQSHLKLFLWHLPGILVIMMDFMMVLNSIINGNTEMESHIVGIPIITRDINLSWGFSNQLRHFPCIHQLCLAWPWCIENSEIIIYFCSLPPGHSKQNSAFFLILCWSDIKDVIITEFASWEGFLSLNKYNLKQVRRTPMTRSK